MTKIQEILSEAISSIKSHSMRNEDYSWFIQNKDGTVFYQYDFIDNKPIERSSRNYIFENSNLKLFGLIGINNIKHYIDIESGTFYLDLNEYELSSDIVEEFKPIFFKRILRKFSQSNNKKYNDLKLVQYFLGIQAKGNNEILRYMTIFPIDTKDPKDNLFEIGKVGEDLSAKYYNVDDTLKKIKQGLING